MPTKARRGSSDDLLVIQSEQLQFIIEQLARWRPKKSAADYVKKAVCNFFTVLSVLYATIHTLESIYKRVMSS
jgi:hypothetical protein